MAILIETMRGGFRADGGPTSGHYKQKAVGPRAIEHLFIDCDENFIGIVSEKLSRRKGRMVNLVNHGSTGSDGIYHPFTFPDRLSQ